MPKYINTTGQEIAQAVVIATYFRKPDETIKQFSDGLKGLTDADKEELARGAAKEMGYTITE